MARSDCLSYLPSLRLGILIPDIETEKPCYESFC